MSLKAFELVPVVDKVNLGGDTSKSSIECIEVVQENMYLGTTNCFLIHYAIQQGTSPTGKTTFVNKLQRHKHLGLRKPIKQLLAFPTIGQLLFLCDSCVYPVSMYGLELCTGNNKELFKGVTVMARNNKPPIFNPDEVQICLGTRHKTVQIITLTNDRHVLLKEISVLDPPSVLAIDAQTICTTLGNQYFLINYVTSAIQELFMYEAHNTLPMVKRIGHEEFLLNGPTNTMGMIVTADGLSQHQPLTWCDGLQSVAYSYPYILALGSSTVTMHSMLDQRQKQAMSFTGGIIINDFNNQSLIFIAVQNSVMSFIPVPLGKQIQMLLINKRVDEAFDLLVVANQSNPKEYSNSYVKQVRAQAGFLYFADADFEKALDLFIESSLDPREVIALYPLMMPPNDNFNLSRPLLHSIKDLTVVVKGSKTVFAEAKKFLLRYLQRSINQFPDAKVAIDTALMKLYAECNHAKLSDLVSNENNCVVEETISWLNQFKHYHSLALFYFYLNHSDEALEIWHKLMDAEIEDGNFPGINFVVKFLSGISDKNLIFNSMMWLLGKDEKSAVKVFTERESDECINPDYVSEFLQHYPIALQYYLEYLVFKKCLPKERFHTRLAVIYIDQVLKLMADSIQIPGEIEGVRSKLQTLLESSSLYRISTLLQKISNNPLYQEVAILYGKMDQHDRALKILVYKLKDFDAAERYCDVIAKDKDEKVKENVFHMLLHVYLEPDDDVHSEHLALPAVKLLNSRPREFNMMKVLEILPDDWSVDLINSFLSASIRQNLSSSRQARIESALSRQQYLNTKHLKIASQNGVVNMTDESTCDFCKKPFTEAISARYPNGVLVHVHCSKNKHVCPVTGIKFN